MILNNTFWNMCLFLLPYVNKYFNIKLSKFTFSFYFCFVPFFYFFIFYDCHWLHQHLKHQPPQSQIYISSIYLFTFICSQNSMERCHFGVQKMFVRRLK